MILKDNSKYSSNKENLNEFLPIQNIANRNIAEILDEYGKNLLIYPHSFYECADNIDKQVVFSMHSNWEGNQCSKIQLETGNLIGFIGIQGQSISIHSRFSKNSEEDYFLHYMLKKILDINVVNLKHGTNNEQVFNFLLYFFPKLLNEALQQGLYKEYKRNEYNDANIHGTIDINRHVIKNIPFNGRVAYHTREFSYDNHVTELIRHTIEYISTTKYGRTLLEGSSLTRVSVAQIISATPNYKKSDRERLIKDSLKIVRHPYFSNYAPLQNLCVRILKHERIKYGQNKNNIYGILFDVSYLWEEYLASLLKGEGFKHPNNRKQTGRIYLAIQNKFPRYPDFMRERDSIIIDAKYKTAVEQRDDIHQMITYMYRLKSQEGIFIYPTSENKIGKPYRLLGYGEAKSLLGAYFFHIPQNYNDYKDFAIQILDSERKLENHFNL